MDNLITARCPNCRMEFNAADLAGLEKCPVCGKPFYKTVSAPPPFPDSSASTAFMNPANGHVEQINNAWAWVLIFGCIYFAAKGVWTHAVAALLAAVATGGLSWLVYPFFAKRIMRTHYLRKGWRAVW